MQQRTAAPPQQVRSGGYRGHGRGSEPRTRRSAVGSWVPRFRGCFGGQRLDAGGREPDRQLPLSAVVVDALDEAPENARLLASGRRFPARAEEATEAAVGA